MIILLNFNGDWLHHGFPITQYLTFYMLAIGINTLVYIINIWGDQWENMALVPVVLRWFTAAFVIANIYYVARQYYLLIGIKSRFTIYLNILVTLLWVTMVRSFLWQVGVDDFSAGLSLSLSIAGFVQMGLGMRLHQKVMRMISLSTFGIVLLKLVFDDLWAMPTIGKIIVFIILGLILLILSFLYQKLKDCLLYTSQAIWQILSASVKESLGKFSAIPSIDFDTEDMPDIPAFEEKISSEPPKVHYNTDYNPFKVSAGGGGGGSYSRSKVEWEDLYGGLTKASKMNNPQPEPEMDWEDSSIGGEPAFVEEKIETVTSAASSTLYANEPVMEKGNQHLQFKGRFILTSVKSGLMLIDQHRAHIRVLFDRYMVQIQQKQGVSQGVLFPEILQLPASEAAVLQSIMDDLSAVGFDLSNLGGGSYAINGIPSGIEGLNPVELVRNMLHTAMEKGNDVKEEIQNILAITLARAAAIVYGQVLSNEEMVSLVDNLFACPSPNYTPDGKTVLTTIKEEDIERLFK